MKRIVLAAIAVFIFTPTIIQNAQAGTLTELSASHHEKKTTDANGNASKFCLVTSRTTKASARVGCTYVDKFQAYIDDLESRGATVRKLGGIRRGKCWSGGLHPCGKAMDVCQLSRGRVDARCNLPGRVDIAQIASRHGLFEGGRWCNSDYGHVQVGTTAGDCRTTMAARKKNRTHKKYAAAVTSIDLTTADWRGH